MKRITVAPSLVLDDEMFELALAALRKYAPEQVADFTWERFIARTSWVLVPDVEHPERGFYKAEFVIKRGAPDYDQTVKLNRWRSPDLRRDGAPMPHNHPWPFTGHVLMGGIREDRYEVSTHGEEILADPYSKWDVGGMHVIAGVEHKAGKDNHVGLTTFHEVTEVLDPDRTLSLMNCGRGRKDGWGHLEDNGKGQLVYVPNKMGEVDKRFKPLLLALNPHLRG